MDGGKFEPYAHSANEIIERAYMKYLSSARMNFITAVVHIIRYIDDKPQEYTLDFKKMIKIIMNIFK